MRAPVTYRRLLEIARTRGPNAARQAAGLDEYNGGRMDFNKYEPSSVFTFRGHFVPEDELAALRDKAEIFDTISERYDAFHDAALEAVEVLEDQLADAEAAYKAADAYANGWHEDYMAEARAHARAKAALRDAEAKIAELHELNAAQTRCAEYWLDQYESLSGPIA